MVAPTFKMQRSGSAAHQEQLKTKSMPDTLTCMLVTENPGQEVRSTVKPKMVQGVLEAVEWDVFFFSQMV